MCGFVGAVQASGWDVEPALDTIAHRGPDARHVLEVDGVVHGHVRLAIQDPDPRSDQPFRYDDLVLSYAGELWNGDEIREELASAAVPLETTGDTELVAAALRTWGTDALPKFDGMFAIAWTHRGDTWLARDRFGKVPLYYVADGLFGGRWASERRAFRSVRLGAAAEPVPPGACGKVGEPGWTRYYPERVPRGEAGREGPLWVRERLRAGVRKRLVSDVPVCALLSGGLDSTLTAVLAREVQPDLVAYVASWDSESSDLLAARRVAGELGIELREVELPKPTLSRARDAIEAIEIPYKVQVEIAMVALPLAEAIAADGFKVCVCGDGADELFGGYGSLARKATDDGSWEEARSERVRKMARADFVRQNKAFMRYGVEPRAPFLDRELVEGVLGLGVRECPPGKGLLKAAAREVLPDWLVDRDKQTFQGGSGVSAEMERLLKPGQQIKTYNSIAREMFAGLPKG